MPAVNDELIWKEAWAAAQSYVELDEVASGGVLYACLADHTSSTGNQPPNSDFWERIVSASTRYATTAQYRESTKDSDPGNDADIAESLEAVADYIDNMMGFSFSRDAAPTERFFTVSADRYGCAPTVLKLRRPIATATGLVVKTDDDSDGVCEVTWAAGDYELLPLNAIADGQPFTEIHATQWGTKGAWPVGTRISVKATYGYASIPAGVKRECIRLTSIARLDSGWATLRIDDLGNSQAISREARQVAADLLRIYHPTGGVVVA